ncbi:HPF/RaiA family ribosome-associated protein [Candidatus Endoriftia persephonae]|jgi:ribosomal subunit interface protein|uniref:Ribosomal subunit interface protein n=2 Tax=Gammaproteobacteria TaxID=1236 RepID=G2FJY9_9GAMM|nr:HPF/RaiA family ribosome-associated protein [Candidatus Endoriftia persephone]EGW52887.1 hypothetical protein TevJSym_cl00030 [endosymbiont of Tevnia jerichonana (vent Tica)]USF89069.1 HPF/RaiA family ribosome-associated protein [Candidatus Endoriftia persephone]
MHIEIQSRDQPLDTALRAHIERRLGFALGRFSNRINRVEVTLSNLNGPRGGVDQHCQIRVAAGRLPTLVVEETAAELGAAIDRAVDRCGRNLARQVSRERNFSRDAWPVGDASSI